MKHIMKRGAGTAALLRVFVILLCCSVVFPGEALAQKPSSRQGELGRALWECCLKQKFPHATFSSGAHTGYDPDSHRNFAWDKDKQAWIDVKTLEVICPKSQGELGRALWECCLKQKFPHATFSSGAHTGYDPDSHRNFAWDKDKQAWIDTKTLGCICPTCPPSRTAQQPSPTPSTTNKVTDVLKTIGSSVSIGIGGGIGGGDHRQHGDGGHRTAEKVRTGDKSRTTSATSKKTTTGTGHKTVTAACKCHPCTCAPCTCR